MSKSKSTLFSYGFDGMPTAPDVNRLIEKIDPVTMAPGDFYPHTRIAEIIGVAREENRYRTVTGAWRKKLDREHNILILAVPNKGWTVATDRERVSKGIERGSKAGRQLRRGTLEIHGANWDNLNRQQRAQAEHAVRLYSMQSRSLRAAQKEIACAGKVVALPRKTVS